MSEYFSPFSGGGVGFCAFALSSKHVLHEVPSSLFLSPCAYPLLLCLPIPLNVYSPLIAFSLFFIHITTTYLTVFSYTLRAYLFICLYAFVFTSPKGTLFIHVTLSTALLFDWIFDRRFTSPFRHIRSLAQCLQIFKKNSIFYGLRFSIHVFLCFEKKAVYATFSSSILQRFKNPKTLQFMRSA